MKTFILLLQKIGNTDKIIYPNNQFNNQFNNQLNFKETSE